MTRRLVAAFVLGALVLGAPLAIYLQLRHDTVPGHVFDQCLDDIDSLAEACNERIEDANVWGEGMFCRLREAELLLQPHHPDWRGYFAERDRRQYDAEYECDSPEMAAAPWTEEELESNEELLGGGPK